MNSSTNLNDSIVFLNLSRKFKTIMTLMIILIGLVGHFLTILVYSQKRFRLNSSCVFLLSLALVDSAFLITHFFEDTIRTLIDLDFGNELFKSFLNILNIVDTNFIACTAINYLRYVLRFISAYIIEIFTIQRVLIIYFPLSKQYKSKRSAFFLILTILFVSIILNGWIPFVFKIKKNDKGYQLCEIDDSWMKIYFILCQIYIFLIIVIPICSIIISNILIIVKTFKENSKIQSIQVKNTLVFRTKFKKSSRKRISSRRTTTTIFNQDQNNNKKNVVFQNKTKKMTRLLILISILYVLLNLPYLISWLMFYMEISEGDSNSIERRNFKFALVQLTEILNVSTYSINFFFYCLSGTLFRHQLKFFKKKITIV